MNSGAGAAGVRLRGPGGRGFRPAGPLLALALLIASLGRPTPEAGLRVLEPDGRWTTWWRESDGRDRWGPTVAPLLDRVAWSWSAPGLETARLAVGPPGPGAAVELILARVDPDSVRFSLAWGLDRNGERPAWSIDDAPADALLSLNAGMFLKTLPWGWVRLDGADRLAPGRGPLSSALIVDRQGRIGWIDGDGVQAARSEGSAEIAFQSYPTLLVGDGEIPAPLREGRAIDRFHRDIRLALGLDRRGRLLAVLTRCRLPLPAADRLPFGLTVPEMAHVMGALGARQAMLLDGGLSAQMLVRSRNRAEERWAGLRKVPLGLIVRAREDPRAGPAAAVQRF